MSRAPWAGRQVKGAGAPVGAPALTSVTTALACASGASSVNSGPPVGLPPDVLQHVLTFLDGRGLAVCEQVCKGLRSTTNDKALWRTALHRDFAFSRSQRLLASQGTNPRAAYGRRLQEALERSRATARRAQEAKDNLVAFKRKLCWARGLTYGCSVPMQFALAWAPFVFLLLLVLRLDEKIQWSWWAIFAPAYGPLYLFVALAMGACCLQLAKCSPCAMFNEERACALKITKKFGSNLNGSRALALFLGLLTVAVAATWFVTLALKLEGTWDVSYVTASFPLWTAYGLCLLFALTTICAGTQAYAIVPLVVVVTSLTIVPALIVRADGKDIRLERLFIPEWIGYGAGLLSVCCYCLRKTCKSLARRRCLYFVKGLVILIAACLAVAPPVITLTLLSTNGRGVTHVSESTVFALLLVCFAGIGVVGTVLLARFAASYGEHVSAPSATRSPDRTDVFHQGQMV